MNISQSIRSSLQTITPIWSAELISLLAIDSRYSTIINIILNFGTQVIVCDEYSNYLLVLLIIGLSVRFGLKHGLFKSSLWSTDSSVDMSADLELNGSAFIERVLFAEPKYLCTHPCWCFYKGMYTATTDDYKYNTQVTLANDIKYRVVLDDSAQTSLLLWFTQTRVAEQRADQSADQKGFRTQHIKFIKGNQDTYLKWINTKKAQISGVTDKISIVRPMKPSPFSSKQQIYWHTVSKQPFYGYHHKRLDYIIRLVESVCKVSSSGQPKHIGIILHGPPGTGKTSLCRRIAELLLRNIIMVDLMDIRFCEDLYSIMYNGNNYGIKNVVISLDEFDKTCEKFVKFKELELLREEYNMKQFTKMLAGEGSDKKLESVHTYDWDIDKLLTCLSGPIVPDGRIVIATCNNLETIRQLCPELIREGRMTPIECPYGDFDDLIAIAKDHGVDLSDRTGFTDFRFRQSAIVEFIETQQELTPESVIAHAIKTKPE